ncbi:MAG: phage portal protein [Agrobacterium vaccinii]
MFGFGKKTETAAATADEQRSLATPDGWLLELFGATPSAAGIVVSPESALKVPAVAAGVRAISEAVSIFPLHTYTRAADGSRQRNAYYIASRLLNADANPWTRGPQLRELLTADAICYDAGGFAEIVRDGDKKPRELHRIHPSTVTIEIDNLTGEPRYRVNIGSGSRFIDFRDMLHLRAPSPLCLNNVSGKSPLMQAKDAIGLLITLQQHACLLFKNGGRPSGILSFPQKLGSEVAKRIKASWQAATGGSNSGGTAVLEEGGSFTPLSFNSVDSQFLEIWALAITEVARILRVPPTLLMDFSRATWSNGEQMGLQFLTYSLSPWLSRWESEVTLKLIAPEDRDEIFVEHLTDALLKSDFAARATAYGQYRSMGAMTANEVRAGLNLAPLPDGNVLQNPYTTTDKTPKTEGNPDE